MYPGEYTQPLVRKTFVQVPVVSGYVAARLQAQDWYQPVTSGSPATALAVTYENVGNTYFSVVLRSTNDRSISGIRTTLNGSAKTMCPGGVGIGTADTAQRYLEVFCTGTTTGQLRMQLESQRQWTELGFDKVEDSTIVPGSIYGTGFYPTKLWQAKEQPGPVSAP